MQQISPIWHSLSTAGMIGAIAFLALTPNPAAVDWQGIIRGAIAPSGSNATEQAGGDVSANTGDVPPAVMTIATQTAEDFNIPLGVILAIARHETGHFRAMVGSGNAWGLKCVNNDPSCTTVRTQEHTGGTVGTYLLSFESCTNAARCSRLLGETLQNLNSSQQWADIPRAVRAVGAKYATDPKWADKVITLLPQQTP